MPEQILILLLFFGLVVINSIPRISFLRNWKKLLDERKNNPCSSGKVSYATIGLATKAMERLLIKKNQKLRYYRCPQCTNWHLTHKSKHERVRHHREKARVKTREGELNSSIEDSLVALKNKYSNSSQK